MVDHFEDASFKRTRLWRVSEFQRAMGEAAIFDAVAREGDSLTVLSASLLAELERMDLPEGEADLLEVVAACIRSGQHVALYLARHGYVLPITLFPREGIYHTPQAAEALIDAQLSGLKLLQVEPATLRPPGSRRAELISDRHRYHPLPRLLWSLALHGPRNTLLTEIDGPALYRAAPGFAPHDLDVRGAYAHGVHRLQHAHTSLRALSGWPGFSVERGARLLNALYLQGALIVNRTHPSVLSNGSALSRTWRQWLGLTKSP